MCILMQNVVSQQQVRENAHVIAEKSHLPYAQVHAALRRVLENEGIEIWPTKKFKQNHRPFTESAIVRAAERLHGALQTR